MTFIAILFLIAVLLIAAFGIALNSVRYVGTAVIVLCAAILIWIVGGTYVKF